VFFLQTVTKTGIIMVGCVERIKFLKPNGIYTVTRNRSAFCHRVYVCPYDAHNKYRSFSCTALTVACNGDGVSFLLGTN